MIAQIGPRLRIFSRASDRTARPRKAPATGPTASDGFAELNRQIETATGGELSIFGTNEHVQRIAAFALAMVFSNGHFVNFSDGSHNGRLNAPLLSYLGERLEMPVLSEDSAAVYRHVAEEGIRYSADSAAISSFTRAFFLNCPDDMSAATIAPQPDAYFPDYGAVVARGTDKKGNFWEFAAKGGHNEEMHNHNDVRKFPAQFQRPARADRDRRARIRSKDFFRIETRYQFLAARSLGHSVPLVNGCEQPVGEQFAETVVECKLEADKVTFVARPDQGLSRTRRSAAKLVRTFTLRESRRQADRDPTPTNSKVRAWSNRC